MKHNISKELQKAPKLNDNEIKSHEAIKKWLFGKKKTIWDYLKDASIDSDLRETVYYWMYGAVCIINAYKDDPAWNNTIRYLDYIYGAIMNAFESKNYGAITRLMKDSYNAKIVKIGRQLATQDGRPFPY